MSNLQIQKPAPAIECEALVNGEFQRFKLSDHKGKYVLLFFYPMDFTFVCPTEILAFNDRAKEFKALDCEVVGASTDTLYSHLAWTRQSRKEGGIEGVTIPLLADVTKKVARDYRCLIEEEGVALRSLYIIDPEQKLRIIHLNDLPIGRSVDEALRLVEALHFHAKHGEVCPANWQKGQGGIVPEDKKSKQFFNQ